MRPRVVVAAALLSLIAIDVAVAQFGVPRPPDPGGFAGYILAKQAEFYRMLSGTIRAAKTDGSAAYTLIGISFLYGIFHAAGPGHGKAVISSYVVANDETWKRGLFLSFASAMLQAFTAIAIVGIAAALLGATARTMGDAVRVIEIVSYGLIVLIGLRPCSGAILVLVFALAQGLFWLGVVSTFAMGIGTAITVAVIAVFAVAARSAAARFAAAKPGPGMILLRLFETGAAVLIVLFGAALLTGYLASERLLGA